MHKVMQMAVFLTGVFIVLPAMAIDDLVVRPSKYSVAEAMDRLEAVMKQGGATIHARIDLKSAAQKGELLRPHQIIIFGRGGAIQPFLSAASSSAIDLPQKIIVFEDANGKAWVAYNTGEYAARRHGISNAAGIATVVAGINKTVSGFVNAVAE